MEGFVRRGAKSNVIHVALGWFRKRAAETAPDPLGVTPAETASAFSTSDERANPRIARIIDELPQRRKREHGRAA